MFALGSVSSEPTVTPLQSTDMIAGGYTMIPQKFYHPNAARNALGLVGGNDVSVVSGNIVDLESDLRGITRTLSKAPSRQYQPSCALGSLGSAPGQEKNRLAPACAGAGGPSAIAGSCPLWPRSLVFAERATGHVVTVNTAPRHLPTSQFASYPGVPAPEPLVQEVYGSPWRF
jgi:hypothetical protein